MSLHSVSSRHENRLIAEIGYGSESRSALTLVIRTMEEITRTLTVFRANLVQNRYTENFIVCKMVATADTYI
ncbi:Protein of unknown function [Cotesia congregata]|uniref:Uncharacterized protein n=1 Tax=Cotesia congregata TaxID=51543 RepID=A0A8J2ED71_COTCN|nr:Protein of unknown function [Cotesia congregata]